MAKIVAAFGASHSVMLYATREDWQHRFPEVDPTNPWYFDKLGNKCTWDDLLAKAPANSAEMVTPEKMGARYDRVQEAMDEVGRRIRAAKLDVLIVCGDDQNEVFDHTNLPSIAMYHGDKIRNGERKITPGMSWYKVAQAQRQEPDGEKYYPVDGKLATYLVRGLCDRDFDITAVSDLRPHQFEGHAFSFVHKRLLPDFELPIIPIFLNTFDPPNQPTPRRCTQFGKALRELIEAYPEDTRVGLLASGGLSHFVVDEELDHQIIDGIKKKDFSFLSAIEPKLLQAGSSEIRNWLVIAEAARDFDLTWVDYTPGYRTKALTGTGLAFGEWTKVG